VRPVLAETRRDAWPEAIAITSLERVRGPNLYTAFRVMRAAARLIITPCRNRRGVNVTEPAAHGASATSRESDMKYVLLIYGNETAMTSAPETAMKEMVAAYGVYSQAMVEAGVMVAGERLRPSSAATTVRTTNGKTQVLDGPYAETKEQLGGFYVIEAPDLDAALSWAERCPGASHGVIEVRPIWAM
jgi:hypothetical protein